MTCHIIGQRLFWGQMRLGLLLNSTDATTYWQKRAGILDKQHSWVRVHTRISHWLARYSHHFLVGYLGAVLLSGVAIAATLLLVQLIPTFAYPGTLVILATLITTRLWGAGPSLLATLLEAFLCRLSKETKMCVSWCMTGDLGLLLSNKSRYGNAFIVLRG
jgi:hypothetical protein